MKTIRAPAASLAGFILFFLFTNSALGSFPKAENVTWISTNFKTLLTWGPKPSEDYSYTVEFSLPGQNGQRNFNCIRSSATVCDLTSSLTELKAYYTAEVLSKPPLGETSDGPEIFTRSPRFSPYKDTGIGRPDFKLEVSEDKKKTTLHVTDPLTALFKDGHQQSIRDIFGDELEYKVTYRKNQSTGKKTHISKSSVIEIIGLDRGESYCFYVQAFIPSRSVDKQLGEESLTECTKHDPSIFDMYSVGVIAAAILLILLVIVVIVAVTVICCKRRNKAQKSGKEGVPLQRV
ncbi:coagulation factor IIIa [Scomber japonicus]|uniref:coagulation factor IIIa n=1 Tax=Scomber japonicus TaxID=13676 RepID=UPI002306966F|nr:coagulation factor IIIa [Scomber japonicus]